MTTTHSPELRVGATFTLAMMSQHYPTARKREADARLDLAAAIIAMDATDGIPGRHNLQEQADVETALRAYGNALADLIRGEE